VIRLLGVGDENATKVFFPGSDDILRRRIDSNTCVLLICQSGQTFPTLHATRKMAKLAFGKVWILTGCFNSKMEQAVVESYAERGKYYSKDRIFNNYSGHRPAEPSSVAVAATWHSLTRLLMHIIDISRKMCPAGRIIHEWERDQSIIILQSVVRRFLYLKKKNNFKSSISRASFTSTFQLAIVDTSEKTVSSPETNVEVDQITISTTGPPHNIDNTKTNNNHKQPLHRIPSTLLSEKATPHALKRIVSNRGQNFSTKSGDDTPQIVMNLSDGCIDDIKSLVLECLIPNLSDIVGYDQFGNQIESTSKEIKSGKQPSSDTPPPKIAHEHLVAQGIAWSEHVNEPWHMLVLCGLYIIVSVGCSITFFGIIGDAILAIIRAAGGDVGRGYLVFTPRIPSVIYHQGIGYTLIGALLQLLDGIFFVYIGKNFTRLTRLIHNRPLAARHGKRTLVIVDTSCVHQLTEIFVSKLFSQSYSVVSLDVHGASGLDHFVHRFTHRTVRGLLMVVGRPDGRLCCLAKSEASILLSAKQAAFIRNPDYTWEGNGPEIVTVGHNPFQPNMGLAKHIVLENKDVMNMPHFSTHHSTHGIIQVKGRRKFVDEYIYDRLFLAQKPFTLSILRQLRRTMEQGSRVIHHRLYNLKTYSTDPQTAAGLRKSSSGAMMNNAAKENRSRRKSSTMEMQPPSEEPLPYGVHHIDPNVLVSAKQSSNASVLADFIIANKELLNEKIINSGKIRKLKDKSSDPAVRLAFSSKLDSTTREIQDLQVIVQQFYECRIASLERYVAYCVMFHAMAKHSSSPWLLFPWDIARSQSNLRVATTGKE
jgi:hypothetical protein